MLKNLYYMIKYITVSNYFRKELDSMKLPKIGMRMIKTVIAVYICFLIAYFRDSSAFYSAIAAIISLQTDIKGSLKSGMNRITGTLIGGTFGIVLISILSLTDIKVKGILYYTIVAAVTLPLMYTIVLINKAPAVFIGCVVFFSIVVNRSDMVNPIMFGLGRMLETFIGIGVSWAVNIIPLYFKDLLDKKR